MLGTLLCLAITPLFVFTVNVTLLAHHYQWELGRLSPFLLVEKWIHTPVTNELATAPLAAPLRDQLRSTLPFPNRTRRLPSPQYRTLKERQSSKEQLQSRFRFRGSISAKCARTLGVVFLVLTGIGFVRGRRELLDPRKAVLGRAHACRALGDLGACERNRQYERPILFASGLPRCAVRGDRGLVVIRQLERLGLDRAVGLARPAASCAPLSSRLLVAGWTEASFAHHSHRGLQTRLGRWIEQQAGPFHSVVADFNSVRPAYTACHGMPDVVTFDEFYDLRMDRFPPDLAIFYPDGFRHELLPHLVIRAAKLGLMPLDLSAFSPAKPEFVVFVRNRH